MKNLLASLVLAFVFLATPSSAGQTTIYKTTPFTEVSEKCPGGSFDEFINLGIKHNLKQFQIVDTAVAKVSTLINSNLKANNMPPRFISRFVFLVARQGDMIVAGQFDKDDCLIGNIAQLNYKQMSSFLEKAGIVDSEIIELKGI